MLSDSSWYLLNIPTFADSRGCTSVIESGINVPFEVKRVYYLYNWPVEMERGGHSHIALWSVIIPLSGELNVLLDNGSDSTEFRLRLPHQGLVVGPRVWRELRSMSDSTVCLILASNHYDDGDFIRSYDEFQSRYQAENSSGNTH